jgi:hypothetical protein
VIGLVEESGGFSLQIMETTLAGSQVAHHRSSAILPILSIGTIAEVPSDDKSIFLLKRTAHFRQRIITSKLRDGHIRVAQCPGNDCGCIFDSVSLTKPTSISVGHHSIHSRGFVLLKCLPSVDKRRDCAEVAGNYTLV